jgi:eukaryotic-like serine/threonine-protein kinase
MLTVSVAAGSAVPRSLSRARSDGMSEIDGKPDRSPISTVTLSVVEGPASGTQYLYSERTTAIAGRADDCEPRIDEPGSRPLVSRHHCLFDINPPAIRVRDFGSLNGTYVNGEEIGRRRHDQPPKEGSRQIFAERDLVDGDRITLGSTILQVDVTDSQQTLIDPSTTESCSECGDLVGAETQEAIGETIIHRLQAGEIVLPEMSGYDVVEELGRGGQGVVYLARHHHSGKLIALKMMLAQVAVQSGASEKFKRQIAAVDALHHPNIVSFREAGNIGAAFFFTSEYCSGGSLDDLIARGGPLPPERAVPLALQALDGLEYAHTAKLADGSVGLVHRDIKPANILLEDQGSDPVVKIADFGLAKAFDGAGLSGLTLTGTVEGTLAFMARSQVIKFKYVEPDVDVWAMAATLYFMLTAQLPRPFKPGTDPVQVVLEEDAVPIRQRDHTIPKSLAEVIDAALVDNPRIDTISASQLAAALREAL